MNYEKNIENKNHFALDRIQTHNRQDQRQVIYPLHYKYRLVITDLTTVTTVTTVR